MNKIVRYDLKFANELIHSPLRLDRRRCITCRGVTYQGPDPPIIYYPRAYWTDYPVSLYYQHFRIFLHKLSTTFYASFRFWHLRLRNFLYQFTLHRSILYQELHSHSCIKNTWLLRDLPLIQDLLTELAIPQTEKTLSLGVDVAKGTKGRSCPFCYQWIKMRLVCFRCFTLRFLFCREKVCHRWRLLFRYICVVK